MSLSRRLRWSSTVSYTHLDVYKRQPLFIYGGSGLGKTHLLHAICTEIRKNKPDCNIIYVKGEMCIRDRITATS